jgi:hypothetical protein
MLVDVPLIPPGDLDAGKGDPLSRLGSDVIALVRLSRPALDPAGRDAVVYIERYTDGVASGALIHVAMTKDGTWTAREQVTCWLAMWMGLRPR